MTVHVLPQPFDNFLKSVVSADYDEYRSLPGSRVESSSAFEAMRQYVLDLYKGVGVVASYVESDGRAVDCIPADRYPGVEFLNGQAILIAPLAAQPAPQSYKATPPSFTSPLTEEISDALPRLQDRERADTGARCPPDTIPMYRTTLEQLSRFENLTAFCAKDRVKGTATRVASSFPKRYATGEQDVACLGGGSHVNVWKPFATPSLQATFSQQWYIAGQDGTLLQSVECGWHVDIARYQNAEPHLFVYSTRQNYDDGHSFYNQDGGVYKPVANPYVLPGAPLTASQVDGTQIAHRMGFYLTDSKWVFYFDDHAVGYYPLAWFRSGPLASGAKRIRFGGEVGSGLSLWPPMGSGRHAAAGFGKTAYQRAAFVNPAAGGAIFATLSEAGSTTGPCYTVDITNNSASDWGTYLFFGGPGGQPC